MALTPDRRRVSRDAAENRGPDIAARVVEVRVIQQIEGLTAEFHAVLLGDPLAGGLVGIVTRSALLNVVAGTAR